MSSLNETQRSGVNARLHSLAVLMVEVYDLRDEPEVPAPALGPGGASRQAVKERLILRAIVVDTFKRRIGHQLSIHF